VRDREKTESWGNETVAKTAAKLMGINVEEVRRSYYLTYRGKVIDPKLSVKNIEKDECIHI
jgi:hypothetical protein